MNHSIYFDASFLFVNKVKLISFDEKIESIDKQDIAKEILTRLDYVQIEWKKEYAFLPFDKTFFSEKLEKKKELFRRIIKEELFDHEIEEIREMYFHMYCNTFCKELFFLKPTFHFPKKEIFYLTEQIPFVKKMIYPGGGVNEKRLFYEDEISTSIFLEREDISLLKTTMATIEILSVKMFLDKISNPNVETIVQYIW